jgi:hypothetical protein
MTILLVISARVRMEHKTLIYFGFFLFVYACTTRGGEREKKERRKKRKAFSTNNIIAITHPANRPTDRLFDIPIGSTFRYVGSTVRWVHLLVVGQS